MKKQVIVAGIATVVSVAGLGGIGVANAATSSSTDNGTSLIDEIVSKFKLNKSEVQAVFDAHKSAADAKRETEFKDKLATLVKDGKLTQAQSDKIIAKRAELQKEREAERTASKDETEAERKAKMDANKTALETWAKDNGISTDYLYLLQGGGHGGPGVRGMKSDTDTAS